MSVPADLTWDEFVGALEAVGFTEMSNSGGSHRTFIHANGKKLSGMVKPHSPPLVRRYLIREAIAFLIEHNFIEGN
ncbi:addiction module toxin, HicA family [Ralstonia pickettii]|uniref:Addiction module toxin, HicA family n=1 Tax=Ralstonia pickettii TaxID=329 RepID=A0A7X2HMV3_RALPI|nr:addiction module toxin, HicA family [Ralstonia pickettii]